MARTGHSDNGHSGKAGTTTIGTAANAITVSPRDEEVVDHAMLAPISAAPPFEDVSESDSPAADSVQLGLRLQLLDSLAILLGWSVVGLAAVEPVGLAVAWIVEASLTTLIIGRLQRIHLARTCVLRSTEFIALGRTVVYTAGLVTLGGLLTGFEVSPRLVVAGGFLTFILLTLERAWYRRWVALRRKRGLSRRPVLVVGTNAEAAELVRLCLEHPEIGYDVVGALRDGDGLREVRDVGVPILGSVESAASIVASGAANGVLIPSGVVPAGRLNALAREIHDVNGHVVISSGLHSVGHQRLVAHPLARQPLFYLEPRRESHSGSLVKRAIDIVGALVALVVTLPLFAAAALAVKLFGGPGPVFYRQERLGRHGKPFRIVKFRTMVSDADKRVNELRHRNQRSGPLFKMAADPRVTRVGRVLRMTSIDELPQLLNVLAGSMSLVGPRPALASESAEFDDELQRRLEVKPGITGLWQVDARDNPYFGAYRRLDLYYVENWSVALDLSILFATFGVVLGRMLAAFGGRKDEATVALD